MKLKVPRFKQGYKACAATSLQSVTTFYGGSYSQASIWSRMNSKETGHLGLAAIRMGYAAEVVSFADNYFKQDEKRLSQRLLLTHLKKRTRFIKDPEIKSNTEALVRMMDAGGKMLLEVPTRKTITRYLRKGMPVIALVSTNMFYGEDIHKKKQNGHYLVITGEDGDNYFITDPSDFSERFKCTSPGKYKVTKDHLLFSCYARKGGWLLTIKPVS